MNKEYNRNFQKILSVLGRSNSVNPMRAFDSILVQGQRPISDISNTAIGFDANSILRLATHKKMDDILDIIQVKNILCVVPEQALQEFWNNELAVADSVNRKIKIKLDELKKYLSESGVYETDEIKNIEIELNKLEANHGYLMDPKYREKTKNVFEFLSSQATVVTTPREKLVEIANLRKKSKTPPGFKDDGYGDFFCWVDLIFALMINKKKYSFESVLWVTSDKKMDWSRESIPHPILIAEMKTLVGANLYTCDLDKLAELAS